MSILCALVFYGGGGICLALAARTLIVAWRGAPPVTTETQADHWRRVHITADRRAPYSDLRLQGERPRANFRLRRRA